MEEIAVVPGTEIATPETPTPETPETPETPTPETPETPADGSTDTGEGEDEPLPGDPGEGDAVDTDGRTLDQKTSATIAQLKKLSKTATNPEDQKLLAEAAKTLADKHFRFKAYEKEFPTVQDARQAKATLESLGGEEGITSMQEEVSDYRKEIEQFSNGDRGLIEQLYKGNPESTVKMVEAALDVFRDNNNIAALDQVLISPMVERLKQVGLHSNLLKAAEFVKAGDGQKAYDTLSAIGEWLAKVTGDAETFSKNRTVKDPREEQYQQREQKVQEQEREHQERVLSEEITKLNNRDMAKVLDPFFKEMRFNHEAKREFAQNVLTKVWAAMKADKVYLRNAHNIRAKGDDTRTAQFINVEFAKHLPGVFRAYKNSMYPNLSRVPAKTNGREIPTPINGKKPAPAAATGTAVKVKDAPAYDTVDWARTPDILWTSGKAYLKKEHGGKYVDFY